MWLKVGIAVVILLWLMRKPAAAAPPPAPSMVPPPGPIEGGYTGGASVDTGPSTITFHEGSGVWDAPWVKPAGGDSGCYLEPDEFGGMRYVCQ